jgi:predicted Zn-dependent protease
MKQWKKWVSTALLGTSLVAVPAGSALAASAMQTLLYGAASMVIIKQQLTQMDNKQQGQMLAATQKKTGVESSEEYSQRLETIHQNLVKTGLVKRDYDVYANPSKEMNAFETIGGVISVNKGMMDTLNDSELAFTLSHEMEHGEKRHAINGVMKSIAISTAVDLAFGGNGNVLDILLGSLAVNYIDNEVVTMDQEKEADHLGFDILKNSQYNVGGAASSMVLVYEKYGELYTEGWKRAIMPNNHPQMSSRIEKLGQRMTKWSGNRVQVGGATVYVNALPVVTPAADGDYSSRRRAYLVAGSLAGLLHGAYGEAVKDDKPQLQREVQPVAAKKDGAIIDKEALHQQLEQKTPAAVAANQWQVLQNGSEISVNDTHIITCAAGDDGAAIVSSLNTALQAKPAMLSKDKISSLNKEWIKKYGYKEKKKDKTVKTTDEKDSGTPAKDKGEVEVVEG